MKSLSVRHKFPSLCHSERKRVSSLWQVTTGGKKNILKGLLLNRWSTLKIGHHYHIGGGPTLVTPADWRGYSTPVVVTSPLLFTRVGFVHSVAAVNGTAVPGATTKIVRCCAWRRLEPARALRPLQSADLYIPLYCYMGGKESESTIIVLWVITLL